MGNKDAAVATLRQHIQQQGRSYIWVARATNLPYKRILSEVKHERSRLSLETAVAIGEVLGVELPELIGRAA